MQHNWNDVYNRPLALLKCLLIESSFKPLEYNLSTQNRFLCDKILGQFPPQMIPCPQSAAKENHALLPDNVRPSHTNIACAYCHSVFRNSCFQASFCVTNLNQHIGHKYPMACEEL